MKRLSVLLLLPFVVAACSTTRDTLPPRAATEQLLISAAVDRAARHLDLDIPADKKVYLDTGNFEGNDSKYAIGAIRDHILKQGIHLVGTRNEADAIVEIRAGALSIDESRHLIGIPGTELPIPLAGQLKMPEIALFKKHQWQSVAKIAATAYDAKSGTLIASSGPQYGYAHKTKWVVLLFMTKTTDDLKPEKDPWWDW